MSIYGRMLACCAVLALAGCGATEAVPDAPATSTPAVPASSAPPPLESAHGPTGTPAPRRSGALPPVVNHGPRRGKRVALTFDADMTDAMIVRLRRGEVSSYANLSMLDLLEKRKIPATFFVTGQWAEQYPQVTRRLAANPRFELANHSYEHAAFTADCYGLPRLPAGRMTGDVARTFRVLEPFGGRQTRYFRFPGLCHDKAALRALAPLGVTVVDGDVVSGDPFARSAAPVVQAVLSTVRPGSIVIMHVTEANAQYTDEALPLILAGLQRRGLEPVTLSELLGEQPG
ncbi:polysaccharide deacetylase family protein [Couchioplanes caeruleus]|uniref:Peptidoglycan/xylan/chitin deacetylase (PgdA/CDA1 family) n=1 Tax=Couchioplanes caeruleus TaxID=56438 RepID=A0A3N1GE97_9ACTN|nr:polysaccharide deacetylase family protein [Couchioplanes caeruleus]ROP28501.1 peptidoglycan/xylan/chitin deacetylase (PgdA/CDA1 family) [Couchioplanes caeruleus]